MYNAILSKCYQKHKHLFMDYHIFLTISITILTYLFYMCFIFELFKASFLLFCYFSKILALLAELVLYIRFKYSLIFFCEIMTFKQVFKTC